MPGYPRPMKRQHQPATLADFAAQITALVTARVEAEAQRDNWRQAEAKVRRERDEWKARALTAEGALARAKDGQMYNAPRREYRINSGGKWLWRRWWVESRSVRTPDASTIQLLYGPPWERLSGMYKTHEGAYSALTNIQR